MRGRWAVEQVYRSTELPAEIDMARLWCVWFEPKPPGMTADVSHWPEFGAITNEVPEPFRRRVRPASSAAHGDRRAVG